jgi:hypothetical protein
MYGTRNQSLPHVPATAAAVYITLAFGYSRMVGNPEVILGPDLFGGQVVNAFIFRRTIGN